MIMGGVRNLIETYTSGGSLFANITPNNHMLTYLTDEQKLAGVYITEKVDRKTGWQFVCLEEEWTRGYLQEIQDFMECVTTGRSRWPIWHWPAKRRARSTPATGRLTGPPHPVVISGRFRREAGGKGCSGRNGHQTGGGRPYRPALKTGVASQPGASGMS